MRKLAVLICLLAILLTCTRVVSGSQPEAQSFAITGYTTSYGWETLPSGLTKFHLEAQGGGENEGDDLYCKALADQFGLPPEIDTCAELCMAWTGRPCGVDGDYQGSFTFDEWGIVDLDPITLEGSGRGTNHGIMTITTEVGEVVIRFGGPTDSETVWGNFTVLRGSGACEDLHGQGEYTGDAGLLFAVEFTGRFHTDSE